jgi:hypothetical protein
MCIVECYHLCSLKVMAANGEWADGFVADPDEVFERDLAQRARQKEFLFYLYSSGRRYASACVATLLGSIKFLYGMLICTRVQNYIHVLTNSETVMQEIDLCWQLHDESQWAERSRFDVLSILNIDLRDILEAISANCENVVSLGSERLRGKSGSNRN